MSNYYLKDKQLKELGVRCGKNCSVHSTCIITNPKNLIIGNNVRIDSFSLINSRSKIIIGNYVHIGTHVFLYSGEKGIEIKNYSAISSGVKIYSFTDDYTGKDFFGPFNKNLSKKYSKSKKIIIKKHCIIGSNAVILPGTEFGEGTALGALSLAFTKLKSWSVYHGNPARLVSARSKKIKNITSKL